MFCIVFGNLSLSLSLYLIKTLKYVIGMENVIRKNSANLDKFKKADINEKIKTDQVCKNLLSRLFISKICEELHQYLSGRQR